MSLRLFAVLSLLLMPLSGCIAGVGTMSAESGLSTATDHVTDLLDTDLDPVLIGVASIEPFKRYLETDGDYEFEVNTYADSEQGDGKIPGWAYAFCVGDDLVVAFLATGVGVLADFRESGACDDEFVTEAAITGWEVDSDEAARILADHEDWPEPQEDTVTTWILGQYPDEDGSFPAWVVETDTLDWEDEDHYAFAIINAQTGEVVEISNQYPDFGGINFVETGKSCGSGFGSASSSSILPLVANEIIVSIDLRGTGYIAFDVDTNYQLGDVTVTLEGPDGALYSDVITADALDSDSLTETFNELLPGAYTLSIQVEDVASIGYGYEYSYSTC